MNKAINCKNVWDVASANDREDLYAKQEAIYQRIRIALDYAYADATDGCSERAALMLADWYADLLESFAQYEEANAVREVAEGEYDEDQSQYSRLAFSDL